MERDPAPELPWEWEDRRRSWLLLVGVLALLSPTEGLVIYQAWWVGPVLSYPWDLYPYLVVLAVLGVNLLVLALIDGYRTTVGLVLPDRSGPVDELRGAFSAAGWVASASTPHGGRWRSPPKEERATVVLRRESRLAGPREVLLLPRGLTADPKEGRAPKVPPAVLEVLERWRRPEPPPSASSPDKVIPPGAPGGSGSGPG